MELRRRMKDVMALFLVAVMVISIVPASTLVAQAEGTTGENKIELGSVTWGTDNKTFQFKSPTVQLSDGQVIVCVSIDNDGYFTVMDNSWGAAEASAVTIGNEYVPAGSVVSTGEYTAITLVVENGTLSEDNIVNFIQGLKFYRNGVSDSVEQEVSVAASTVPLGKDMTAMAVDGEIHYYKQVLYGNDDSSSNWYGAYNDAKSTTFNGLRGYLTTITSAAEQYYVYGSLAAISEDDPQLWIGGARTMTSEEGNTKFTFDANSLESGALVPKYDNEKLVTNWYWVCGPEAGTHFYTSSEWQGLSGGNEVSEDIYLGWKEGEPNNSYTDGSLDSYKQEYALEYGFETANWNDYSPYRVDRSKDWGIRGYLIEFSPYNVGESDSSIVEPNNYKAATSTSKIVSLTGANITANNFTITNEQASKYEKSFASYADEIKKAADVKASEKGEDKTEAVTVTAFEKVKEANNEPVDGVYDVTFTLADSSGDPTVVTVKAITKEVIKSGTDSDGSAVVVGADNITVELKDIKDLTQDKLYEKLKELGNPVAVVGDTVKDDSEITVKGTSIPTDPDKRSSGIYTVTFTCDGVDVTVDVKVEEEEKYPPKVDAHDILISTKELADKKNNNDDLEALLKERADAKYTDETYTDDANKVTISDSDMDSVKELTTAGEAKIQLGNSMGKDKDKYPAANPIVNVTVVDNYNSGTISGTDDKIEIGANDFCISLSQATDVVGMTDATKKDISDMLKELANTTALNAGLNVATADIEVDASNIKAEKGTYPVIFTYKGVSVKSNVTVKDDGVVSGTGSATSVPETNLTANDFAVAAESGTINADTFKELANVTAKTNAGTPQDITVDSDGLAALNKAVAAGTKGEVPVKVSAGGVETTVTVTITDNSSVAKPSDPTGDTKADEPKQTIVANDFTLGTKDEDKLTPEIVKKLSNAQAYVTGSKEELPINYVDVSKVDITTPGTYPVELKISEDGETTATIYLTVNGDYETVGDVDKAAEANKTSSTVNQDTAVKTKGDTSGDNGKDKEDTGVVTGAGTATGTVTETDTTITDETGLIPVKSIQDALGVSAETAAKIQDVAKQYDVSLDTLKITDKTIAAQKNDKDMKGTSFGRLKARAIKCKNTQFKLEWTKTKGADGYIIYGNHCNTNAKKYKYKYVKTVGKNTTSMQIKKLEKGAYYKYLVRAYKVIDGKKVTIATSVTVHATTTGGKWGIAKAVNIKKIGSKKINSSAKTVKYTIKKGKTAKISAKEVKQTTKTILHHRDICYESSNTSIATVNKKGKITAKKKGTCKIWVYAQNGVYSTINLTVK